MRKVALMILLILISLIMIIAIPCYAETGLSWNGDFTAESYSLDTQTALSNTLQLKMGVGSGEPVSGVVLFRFGAPNYILNPATTDFLQIYQAYLNLALSENLFIRAGRQKISWGSSYSWNPTNYIGSGKNRAEFMIDNPGVDVVNAECTWTNTSLVAAYKHINNWDESGKAIKGSIQFAQSDLSVSAFTQGNSRAFGLDFATAIGNNTLYCETAWKAGEYRRYVTGTTVLNRPGDPYYIHGVIGISRTFSNESMVILEYYHNQAGWSAGEATDYNNYTGPEKPALFAEATGLLADLRQNYLFLSYSKTGFLVDELTFNTSVVWNADDQSCMVTPMLQYNIEQNAYLALNASFNIGNATSEFGSLPYDSLVNAKMVFSF